MALYEPIFRALNAAGVRFVVVGGMAVVLHGHLRLTADVDIAIDLTPEAARDAVRTLVEMGLAPRIPVDPNDFADPAIRGSWVREKGMQVFSFYDSRDPFRTVDVFAEDPMPFSGLWERSELVPLGSTAVHIASIDDLITLKRRAGRPQDLLDIEALEVIRERRRGQDV